MHVFKFRTCTVAEWVRPYSCLRWLSMCWWAICSFTKCVQCQTHKCLHLIDIPIKALVVCEIRLLSDASGFAPRCSHQSAKCCAFDETCLVLDVSVLAPNWCAHQRVCSSMKCERCQMYHFSVQAESSSKRLFLHGRSHVHVSQFSHLICMIDLESCLGISTFNGGKDCARGCCE